MKFFRVKQDDRNNENYIITGLSNHSNFRELIAGNIRSLPMSSCYSIITSQDNPLPIILVKQLFMVTKDVFDLLDMYIENIDYRCMFLVDHKKQTEEFYYLPQLPVIDCFSEKSTSNIDKSSIETVYIKSGYRYPDIFQVAAVKERVIIVALPLAESLLRRRVDGIVLDDVYLD